MAPNPDAHPTDSILGQAPPVEALRTQIRHLAAFDAVDNPHVPTVLLQGETGTGKGLVARVIHASGPRARGPLVDVNCAAIPETMLEAELFGFEAGAFTDAKRAKPGLFEAASGGVLFLDEVDALSVPLQSKLLKAIEEKCVRRLGAVRPQHVDVKLIAATQKDLNRLVGEGRFRADLYHRLAVVILTIPPLRAREHDIALLAEHFLTAYADAHKLQAKTLSEDAREWLRAYGWPGNVRELGHLMERATLLCLDGRVDRSALERLCVPLASPPPAPEATGASNIEVPAAPTPAGGEPGRIRDALARAGGNVVGAARLLGIGRNALRYRMRRYGIERPTLDDLAQVPAQPRRPDVAAESGENPQASADPSSWEQKPVAVLAIDISFSDTSASEASRIEPWTLTTRWQRRIEEKVEGFGGVFLRRSPSRLLAIFGVPRALERTAEHAVQAALTLRQLASGETGPRPEVRLAVHVGVVRIDTGSRDAVPTALPIGDALAFPERLLGHTGPGELLLSREAARRVESTCELEPRNLQLGSRAADCVTGYNVVKRMAASSSAETIAGSEQATFVGRHREIALLREAFTNASAGHGQVVFVAGDPGIGKSRLLLEFRRVLASEPQLWIEGRCASYGTTTMFLPICDALRGYMGIDDRDDEASASAKIQGAIANLGDDLEWVTPFVRQVLSMEPGDEAVAALDSANRRSETFRALRAIMLRGAEMQPVVVAVEDLHWIDPASEEYLAFVAEAIPTARVLLVCTHRSGYRHPFGDRSYHERVTLRPLSGSEMAEMTGAALPAEVRELIARKAEGNPFFAEEVTKSLFETGTLRREHGEVLLARDLSDVRVPDTIADVLIARMDRLADASKRALQVAAVIGREFAFRLLERIAAAGSKMRSHVDELRALELIYEKAMHPELAYMFKHALTHDVAYASVLPDRRKSLHRTIGLAIEELYADRIAEHYETLAHHFGCSEDWERALRYHQRAADKAAAGYANRAVVEHCQQALAVAERLGDRASEETRRRLEEQLGLACFYLSEFTGSADAYERASGLSRDPEIVTLNLGTAALSRFWAHDYDRMHRSIDRALDIAVAEPGVAGAALALNVRGYFHGVHDGDFAGYERLCREALRTAEGRGNRVIEAHIRFSLAQYSEWTGDYAQAIVLAEQAIAAGRELRLAHLVVWPQWFLGKAACCLGDYGRAIVQLTEAYGICDRIGDRAWKGRLLNTLGWCFGEIGSHARAVAYNERASALAHEIDDHEVAANSEINLAGNRLALGDIDASVGYLEPITAALSRPGDPWMRWRYSLHALDALARVALARGDADQALALADDQLAGARRHRVPKVEARALELRGRALLALDRWEDAEATIEDATRMADRIAYRRTHWQALELHAELERRRGKRTEADELTARARALVEHLATSLTDGELRRDLFGSVRGAS